MSARVPECGHPERKHAGHGLCPPCYHQAYKTGMLPQREHRQRVAPIDREALAVFRRSITPLRDVAICFDAEGWPVVAGARGRLEALDAGRVIAYTRRADANVLLSCFPAARWWAEGDGEARYAIPAEPLALQHVAAILALH